MVRSMNITNFSAARGLTFQIAPAIACKEPFSLIYFELQCYSNSRTFSSLDIFYFVRFSHDHAVDIMRFKMRPFHNRVFI